MEEVNVSLLDANQPEPPKAPRYIILGVIAVFLIAFLIWHQVRYDAEKKVAAEFFSALTSGDVQQAYKIWQPAADYSFKDFQQDWGPNGFMGPIKSFRVVSAEAPSKSLTSVAVRVEVSPYAPLPKSSDPRASKTRSVVIWINRGSHSLSTPPPAY